MSTAEVIDYIQATDNRDELLAIRLAADKKIKAQNASVSVAKKARTIPDDAKQVAQFLYDEVVLRYPFIKEECDLEDWANEVDKLNRIDQYDYSLIFAVARWSQDDKFWRGQVRSGGSLRRHFSKMLVRIKEDGASRAKVFKV